MTNHKQDGQPSPTRHLMIGTAWMVAVRWAVRLIGLVSTVVLARLLTPADYGLVAIASLIVGMVEIFSWTGQYAAIIRHPGPTREHYDSAWTVGLLLGFTLGLVIWAMSPLTTAYFHEPRAVTVVIVLALRTMFLGAVNIGVVNFQRNLQFRRQFYFTVSPTLIAFPVTLTAAFVLRNYWALVIGILTKQAATLVLSYVLEPFRPRLGFSKMREIWSFSVWSLLRSIGAYVNDQVDKFAIGGFAGAGGMGRYSVGRDIAALPGHELLTPMSIVFLPVLAKVQNDKTARRELYLNALYWTALVCTSTSVGVALVAQDMVDLVLGPKWREVGVLVPWFALFWGTSTLSWSVYSAFDTIGRPMISARLQWLRAIATAGVVFSVMYFFRSLLAVAVADFLVAAALTPTLFYALSRALGLPLRDFVATLWRPMFASLLMAAAVLSVNAGIQFAGPRRLTLDMAIGAAVYGMSLMVLWHLVGRPKGPEAEVLCAARGFLRVARQSWRE
jgi:O-antigen/teichoic acid export membrane protein